MTSIQGPGHNKSNPGHRKSDDAAIPVLHPKGLSAIERQMLKASGQAAVPGLQRSARPTSARPSGARQHAAEPGRSAVVTRLPLKKPDVPGKKPAKGDIAAFKSQQDLIACRKELLASMYCGRSYTEQMRTEYQATLSDQDNYWQLLSRKREIYAADQKLFGALGEQIRQHIDHCQRHGSFKEHLQKCADAGSERQLFLITELGKRLTAARLLNEDEVPPAVLAAAKVLHSHLPAEEIAEQLSRQTPLEPEVATMAKDGAKDGAKDVAKDSDASNTSKTAATLNARKEILLAQMEELRQASLDPRERARRVQALRSQWQRIDTADSQYSQDLQQRFSKAGEAAYEPSRQYFAALARKLADNLARRTELAESLRDYYSETDWDSADWKSVESTLRVVRQQWKSHAPTERSKTRPVKELFENSYNNIDTLLQREYDANAKAGHGLVSTMAALSRQPASAASLDALLGIQRQWNGLGLMRDEDHGKLASELRAQQKQVVHNRREQLLAIRSERGEQRQAKRMIKRVEDATALHGEALLNERQAISQLADQFTVLASKLAVQQQDHGRAEDLQAVFKERYARFVAKAERMMQERRVQALEAYHEASRLIGNAEVAYVTGTEKGRVDAATEMAQDYISSLRYLPRNGHKLLNNRLNFVQLHRD